MGHAATETKIQNPGSYDTSGGAKALFWVMAISGGIAFGAGLAQDSQRAWAAFVHNHFYFLCLGLGGIFFAALQWLTGAMWSAPIRRLSESFTAYLPFLIVTMGVLYFGIHDLYVWSHPDHVKGDILLEGKAGYLNPIFFTIRQFAAVFAWLFFARKIIGNSLNQDVAGEYSYTLRNRALAPGFLAVFAITFTMVAFDELMSLDPHWFSTMFGVYCFAGLFYSNLALTCLLTLFLSKKGKLDGIVNDNHLHDLGKFMFAFTIFWAYIGFSQYMLIWYANLPEETGYYMRRTTDAWMPVSVFLLVGKFMTPFFVLIKRSAKRNRTVLAVVAVWMLFCQWVDFLWLVQPEFFKDGPRVGFTEIGTFIGFAGIFALMVSRFLSRNNIVAIGDPRLAESVHHHHQ